MRVVDKFWVAFILSCFAVLGVRRSIFSWVLGVGSAISGFLESFDMGVRWCALAGIWRLNVGRRSGFGISVTQFYNLPSSFCCELLFYSQWL